MSNLTNTTDDHTELIAQNFYSGARGRRYSLKLFIEYSTLFIINLDGVGTPRP